MQLFAAGNSTVVYATTEPTEALLLGGYTAVMDAGELLQYCPTAEVFHQPKSIRVARAFSDPPMNLIQGNMSSTSVTLPSEVLLPLSLKNMPADLRALTVGIRASALKLDQRPARRNQRPSLVCSQPVLLAGFLIASTSRSA